MTREIPIHYGDSFFANGSSFTNAPLDFLLGMAETYPEIFKFRLGPMTVTMVTKPELVREVLVTKSKRFPKWERDVKILGRFLGRGLVTSQGDHHKKQRKMSQPAFHMKRIISYADIMSNYATDMVDTWEDQSVIDISQEMLRVTMYIVTKTIFDVDKEVMVDQANRIGEAIHRLQQLTDQDMSTPIDLPEWLPIPLNIKRRRERKVLDSAIHDIITTRRQPGPDGRIEDRGDLLSMLLLSQEEDDSFLTAQELRDQVVTLFGAGHETTSNALTWTMYALGQNPDVMAKLQAEIDDVLDGRTPNYQDLANLPYTEMVIKEAMRLHPSVWSLNARYATEDTMIGDYKIDAESVIFIAPYVLHHLSEHFENPKTFDPERFSTENESNIQKYSYLPFGAGPRVCIGQAFAMMEARLILATMIQNYEFEMVPDQTITPLPLITMSIQEGLKMKVTNRAQVPAFA